MGVDLPYRLRYLLAWNHNLCRAVLGVYARALLAFHRRRARRGRRRGGQSGCVTVIQRFGGGLNLNVHFHTLVLDGVFTEGPCETLRFQPTLELLEKLSALTPRLRINRARGSRAPAQPVGGRHPSGQRLRLIATVPGGPPGRGLCAGSPAGRPPP